VVVAAGRDGARTLLEGGCNTFAFCKVLLSTIQAVLSLICVPPVPAVVCDVVDSSLVPIPPRLRCRLDVSRLDTSVSERVVNNS
jgi:hypothetical protein